MLFSSGKFLGLHQSCRIVPLKCMNDCYPSTVAVTMKSTLINSIKVWNLIAKCCDTHATKVLPLKKTLCLPPVFVLFLLKVKSK